MAHQQTAERNIPHLRDIFGFHDNYQAIRDEPPHSKYQDNSCRKYNRDKDHRDDTSTSNGNDSAISVGSTSEEELSQLMSQTSTSKKKKEKKKKEKQLTETDVKHLERHLSMKKTIRKKIMRDLQQAFVEDPNEFRVEDIPREQLKAELNLQSLSFGAPGKGKKGGKKSNGESNFLDFLRTGDSRTPAGASGKSPVPDDDDSGHGSPTRDLSEDRTSSRRHQDDEEEEGKKTSFWRRFTMKGRSNKR